MFRPPTTPTANIHLQEKWDMILYETHRYNVRHMKPRVSTDAPLTYMHLFVKPKKLQAEMEKASTIQRENRMLMERLATIEREGGWIDNKNFHPLKSLNTTKRQKEMVDLCYANKIMMERIKETYATYNRNKLEDEYELQKKHKAISLKYPPNWREIRDEVQKKRAEIRRKYVYPRFGHKTKADNAKAKRETTGDGPKDDDVKMKNKRNVPSSEASKKKQSTKSKKEVSKRGKQNPKSDGKNKNQSPPPEESSGGSENSKANLKEKVSDPE